MRVLSINERVQRIMDSNRVIYLEDMTIHEPSSAEIYGEDVLVNVSGGLLYKDTDLMTLDEACDAERFINKIKELLYNN